MIEQEEPGRDLAGLVVPLAGRLVATGDRWEPYRLVDAGGMSVAAAGAYFGHLQAAGRSELTIRSYGMDLLRWFRFLGAIGVPWNHAVRSDARDFCRWLQAGGKPVRPHWRKQDRHGAGQPVAASGVAYSPSVRAHCETVLRSFYDFHVEAGTGPLVNPFPLDRSRGAGRSHAHHNPAEPFRRERSGLYRPVVPSRVPRNVPDGEFNEIFAALGSHRDRERQPGMDYGSLEQLARKLGMFWADLEAHHPGIDSLHLSAEAADGWKQRMRTKPKTITAADGTKTVIETERICHREFLTPVRAFYLDLAQWAAEDPGRWARWAAPCPVGPAETIQGKVQRHRKSRMDARTRERLPVLPVLVRSAARQHTDAAALLRAARTARAGDVITAGAQVLARAGTTSTCAGVWAEDLATGKRRNLTSEEDRAFWAWAAIEVLRATGMFSAGHPLWRELISTFAQLRG